MAEIGYDLSGRRPKALTTELAEWADLIVTMGCGDACPVVPGTRYIDWNLSDPSGLPADDVRKLRDEIQRRVKDLVGELSGPLGSRSPDSAP
jgi:arsenate reductase